MIMSRGSGVTGLISSMDSRYSSISLAWRKFPKVKLIVCITSCDGCPQHSALTAAWQLLAMFQACRIRADARIHPSLPPQRFRLQDSVLNRADGLNAFKRTASTQSTACAIDHWTQLSAGGEAFTGNADLNSEVTHLHGLVSFGLISPLPHGQMRLECRDASGRVMIE